MKVAYGWKLLIISVKTSILDVWQGSEYASEKNNVCILKYCFLYFRQNLFRRTALGVFLIHIFPHSNRIRRYTEYLSVFSLNAGKYGPEKIRILTLLQSWTKYLETFSLFGSIFLHHNETELDYYHQKVSARGASRVAERLRKLQENPWNAWI